MSSQHGESRKSPRGRRSAHSSSPKADGIEGVHDDAGHSPTPTRKGAASLQASDLIAQKKHHEEMIALARGLDEGIEALAKGRIYRGYDYRPPDDEEEEAIAVATLQQPSSAAPAGSQKNEGTSTAKVTVRGEASVLQSQRATHFEDDAEVSRPLAEDAESDGTEEEEGAEDSDSENSFLEYDPREMEEAIVSDNLDLRIRLARKAMDHAEKLKDNLKTDERYKVTHALNIWFQGSLTAADDRLEKLRAQEEGHSETFRIVDASLDDVRDGLESNEMNCLVKLNDFGAKLKNRHSQEIYARGGTVNEAGRQGGRGLSILRTSSEATYKSIDETIKNLKQQVADAKNEVETEEEITKESTMPKASDLLKIIADQQEEVRMLNAQQAAFEQKIKVAEACKAVTSSKKPTPRKSELTALQGMQETLADGVLELLRDVKDNVKQKHLAKMVREDEGLKFQLLDGEDVKGKPEGLSNAEFFKQQADKHHEIEVECKDLTDIIAHLKQMRESDGFSDLLTESISRAMATAQNAASGAADAIEASKQAEADAQAMNTSGTKTLSRFSSNKVSGFDSDNQQTQQRMTRLIAGAEGILEQLVKEKARIFGDQLTQQLSQVTSKASTLTQGGTATGAVTSAPSSTPAKHADASVAQRRGLSASNPDSAQGSVAEAGGTSGSASQSMQRAAAGSLAQAGASGGNAPPGGQRAVTGKGGADAVGTSGTPGAADGSVGNAAEAQDKKKSKRSKSEKMTKADAAAAGQPAAAASVPAVPGQPDSSLSSAPVSKTEHEMPTALGAAATSQGGSAQMNAAPPDARVKGPQAQGPQAQGETAQAAVAQADTQSGGIQKGAQSGGAQRGTKILPAASAPTGKATASKAVSAKGAGSAVAAGASAASGSAPGSAASSKPSSAAKKPASAGKASAAKRLPAAIGDIVTDEDLTRSEQEHEEAAAKLQELQNESQTLNDELKQLEARLREMRELAPTSAQGPRRSTLQPQKKQLDVAPASQPVPQPILEEITEVSEAELAAQRELEAKQSENDKQRGVVDWLEECLAAMQSDETGPPRSAASERSVASKRRGKSPQPIATNNSLRSPAAAGNATAGNPRSPMSSVTSVGKAVNKFKKSKSKKLEVPGVDERQAQDGEVISPSGGSASKDSGTENANRTNDGDQQQKQGDDEGESVLAKIAKRKGKGAKLLDVMKGALKVKKQEMYEKDVEEIHDLHLQSLKVQEELDVVELQIKTVKGQGSGGAETILKMFQKDKETSKKAEEVPDHILELRQLVNKRQKELKKLRQIWWQKKPKNGKQQAAASPSSGRSRWDVVRQSQGLSMMDRVLGALATNQADAGQVTVAQQVADGQQLPEAPVAMPAQSLAPQGAGFLQRLKALSVAEKKGIENHIELPADTSQDDHTPAAHGEAGAGGRRVSTTIAEALGVTAPATKPVTASAVNMSALPGQACRGIQVVRSGGFRLKIKQLMNAENPEKGQVFNKAIDQLAHPELPESAPNRKSSVAEILGNGGRRISVAGMFASPEESHAAFPSRTPKKSVAEGTRPSQRRAPASNAANQWFEAVKFAMNNKDDENNSTRLDSQQADDDKAGKAAAQPESNEGEDTDAALEQFGEDPA